MKIVAVYYTRRWVRYAIFLIISCNFCIAICSHFSVLCNQLLLIDEQKEQKKRMANVTIQARISLELKEQAESVLAEIGLSTADAIRVFLQQTVNSGGLPFQPTAKRPNAETLDAMLELERGGGQVFDTSEKLFADWRS